MSINLDDIEARLERRLKEPLPGIEVQLRMVPEPRPGHQLYHEVEESSLKAGVLLLLYSRRGRPSLLLTKRTELVFHHRGQISLPGGEQHPGESPIRTALRETEEELGIDLGKVRVLGCLTPLYIPPSNYCVYPVVSSLRRRPDFRAQPEEVAEIIEVPLDHFLDPRNLRKEEWTIRGVRMNVPFFEYRTHKIWGATAMILAEFLSLIREEPAGSLNPRWEESPK